MENLLNFFINNVYADTAVSTQSQGGGFSFIIMIVVFFLFIYFAVWRPQNKRAKEQQQLMTGLSKGDEVLTAGGFYGKISKISDTNVTLNIANNVDVIMQKTAIVNVLPKGSLKALE